MTVKIALAIRRQALRAANARARPAEPLRWSEAMAEAPWVESLGAAYETEFRRHYASRLVKRGAALAAAPHRLPASQSSRASGSSGKTLLKRRSFYQTAAEFATQDARATDAGLSWSTWARRKLAT